MRWFIAILCLLIASCTAAPKGDNPTLTPCYIPKYAKSFTIATDSLNRKVLTVTNPYQSDKNFEQQIYLIEDGQSAPKGKASVRIPVERVSVLSSSHIAMFDAIGAADKIVGVSGVKFISNEAVRSHAVEIGYDTALNYERIKAVGTDVILLYGLYGEQSSANTMLTQLSIPYIYIGDYTEATPLGKAEWMVALAYLCGAEAQAIERFTALESRYNTLKESAAQYTSHPKVMLNTPYRDTWFMPSVASYAVQLITDAGGEYIYPQNTSSQSQPISLEQALALATTADVWINVGQCNSLAQLKSENPKFAAVPAVVNRRVYNNTKRATDNGGSDFWESGAVNADILLQDMITLLHSEDCTTDSLYYYKRLE